MNERIFDRLQNDIFDRFSPNEELLKLDGKYIGPIEVLMHSSNDIYYGLVYPRGANRSDRHSSFIYDEHEPNAQTLWLLDTPLGKHLGVNDGKFSDYLGGGVKNLYHISTPVGKLILNTFSTKVDQLNQ